jgi:hypothetical protein
MRMQMHISHEAIITILLEKMMPKSTRKILLGRPTLLGLSSKSINVQSTLGMDARGNCSLETSPESATHLGGHVCLSLALRYG